MLTCNSNRRSGTLQSYATNSFDNHSLLATVNVLKSIIAAAAYPYVLSAGSTLYGERSTDGNNLIVVRRPYSKLADYFGRVEMIGFSIVMYVVGTIVEACAKNMETFCAGAGALSLPVLSVFLRLTDECMFTVLYQVRTTAADAVR